MIGISDLHQPYFLYVSLTMVHAPFQDVTKKFSEKEKVSLNIRDGMITALDKAVGEINEVVKSEKNTILIFMSDNGGRNYPESGIETNTPLRGEKTEVYEGGTRVVGLVQGPGFQQQVSYSGLMHMVDWLPTLVSLAGGNTPSSVDGLDMSQAIMKVNKCKEKRKKCSIGKFSRQMERIVQDMSWFTILTKTTFTVVQVQAKSYGKLGSEEVSINWSGDRQGC